jgi:hypothetical protein
MRLVALGWVCLVGCADEAPRSTVSIDDVMAVLDAAVVRDAALDAALDAMAVGMPPDARVSAAALGCPAVWEECASPASPWRVILPASRFGAEARFQALASDLVLVKGASWRVAQVGPDLTPGEPSFVRSTSFPPGEWDVRGLARTSEGMAVIACAQRCTLLEAPLGASTLRARAELPDGYQVLGLQAAEAALCVFGSDVSCFAGGRWQATLARTMLAPGDDVIALSLTSPRSLALTRSGRVFAARLEGALPEWVEEARVDGVTSVTATGRRALFSDDDSWLERTDGHDLACDVPDGVAAVLVAFGGSPRVVSARGDVLALQGDGFCREQRIEGTLLAASSGACGGAPRVLTASQLIGDNRCDLE